MIRDDVSRIVKESVAAHSKSDTVSKSELEGILTDVLSKFGDSSLFSKNIQEKISREERLRRNLQGLR